MNVRTIACLAGFLLPFAANNAHSQSLEFKIVRENKSFSFPTVPQ